MLQILPSLPTVSDRGVCLPSATGEYFSLAGPGILPGILVCTMTWMSRALQMFYPNVRTTIWPGGKIGNEFALKDTPK